MVGISLFRTSSKKRLPTILHSLLSPLERGVLPSSPSWESRLALCFVCLCSWGWFQDPLSSDHLLKDIISLTTVCGKLVYKPCSGKQIRAVKKPLTNSLGQSFIVPAILAENTSFFLPVSMVLTPSYQH